MALNTEDKKIADNWIGVSHNEFRNLTNYSYELDSLARAFEEVGNTKISMDLSSVAADIRSSTNKISVAIGLSIAQQTYDTQKALGETLITFLKHSNDEVEGNKKLIESGIINKNAFIAQIVKANKPKKVAK